MILALVLAVASNSEAAAPVNYGHDVKPVLVARCTSCHGAIRQKGGLRLDTAEFVRAGGESGPAVEPGKSAESLLIDRVTAADDSNRMPPASDGVRLSDAEVAILRAWIDWGATAPPEPVPPDPREHWAYQPPTRAALPRPARTGWAGNPIDAFLAAGHRSRGLTPSLPVPRELWLRRVYLDLLGLLPTRQERQAYLADRSPSADARIVDRLLADPRHGERWARHWMDVWRYSDWYGLGEEVRYSHPHIWHWRDWIVAAVNADKGYDQMIEEMLAGDELAPDDAATLRATGFLVRNWDIFNRNAWLASTVEHTARAFLGATIQCARCHDHKFDPISQAEYYQLRAFFEPYQIRIDRVPGQPDRTKAGLPRVFDDFVEHADVSIRPRRRGYSRQVALATARHSRSAGGRGQDRPGVALPHGRLSRQARVRGPRGSRTAPARRLPRPVRRPKRRGSARTRPTKRSPPRFGPIARPKQRFRPPPACRKC